MALQKILTQSYIESVFEEVDRGEGLDRFLQESFPYEEDKLLVTPQVKEPVGLLERMVPTTEGDFLSAVALYDAYKSLKPLQAINAQFWESLTLTDLFPYMQKRWNLSEAKDLRKSMVLLIAAVTVVVTCLLMIPLQVMKIVAELMLVLVHLASKPLLWADRKLKEVF